MVEDNDDENKTQISKPRKRRVKKVQAAEAKNKVVQVELAQPPKKEAKEVQQAPAPKLKAWISGNRWVVVAVAALILIILFAPIFPVTRVVITTETVMTDVATQVPYTVTGPQNIKVYTGWLKCTAQSSNPSGYYMPPIIIYGGDRYPHPWVGSNPGYTGAQQQQQQQTYTGYASYGYGFGGSQTITTTKVDPSDEIIDVQYAAAPNNCWDVTLIGQDGNQKVIRDVSDYDLTKTGNATVTMTTTENKTVINQVPQQVTKEVPVQLRVGLFQLIFGLY